MLVLGIVASPRPGGNTEILVNEALKAAREAGADTDIFLVAGKDIRGCDGCHSCGKTKACKIQDDMQDLYNRMAAADAIIFGSPVYFHGVTAQAKAIIDRCFLFLQKGGLKGKVAAPVLALRKIGASQTRSQLYAFFVAMGMAVTRGAVGYGRAKGDVLTGEGAGINISAVDEARNTGREVVEVFARLYINIGI